MKTILITFVMMSSLAGAQTIIPKPTPAGGCELCAKIDKINADADENEVEAARTYAELLDKAKFSKDAKLRKQEYEKALPLAARLVEKDDQLEIAQYLVSIRDEDPALFDATAKKLPEKSRKLLVDWEKKMRKEFKTGGE
ncbi:MAG: hypothetical protein LCH90_10370 [Proteobacteria bacterium]|nr:hypothetical protein [Pseudomonadota bacterium]